MKFYAIGENHLYQKAYTKGAKAIARTVCVYCLRDYAAQRLQKANPEKKKLNRIGLTVSKKLGGAVVRNRVKRILREGYRQVDRETPVKRGFLIVIVAKDAAKEANSRQIAADLAFSMRKLGMLEGMPFPAPDKKPGEQQPRPSAAKGGTSRHGTAVHRTAVPGTVVPGTVVPAKKTGSVPKTENVRKTDEQK